MLSFLPAYGQAVTGRNSLEVSARVKIDGKIEKLTRKRFYLFSGGLDANKDLVSRIGSTEIMSRDCYYTQAKASSEFICWLQAENCESPYCRRVSQDDVKQVPEFLTAYNKGVTQFRGKTSVALDWLTTNLAPSLVNGFYLQRRTALEKALGGIRPAASTMTDSVTVKAIFMDITRNSPGSFTISNVLPIEVGGKSYLWACEVKIEAGKTAKLLLQVPDKGKNVKNCEVLVRDLAVCQTGTCEKK
ncbi:MAG: hypothetical protein ABI539_14795 [Acidobacteriota bacterium]